MKTNAHQYIKCARSWHNREPNILFDAQGLIVGQAYKELTQYYPQKSWLEHNADEIWQSTQALLRQVLQDTGIRASSVAAIGLKEGAEIINPWSHVEKKMGSNLATKNKGNLNTKQIRHPTHRSPKEGFPYFSSFASGNVNTQQIRVDTDRHP